MGLLKIIFILFVAGVLSSNNFRNGEIARLEYSFSGCFASGHGSIILFKIDNVTYARLEVRGQATQVTKLSTEQIKSFHAFVDALRNLKKRNSCTSITSYTLYSRSETIIKTDGGCELDGCFALQQELFKPHD